MKTTKTSGQSVACAKEANENGITKAKRVYHVLLLPTIASNGESNVSAGLWRQSSDVDVDSDASVVMLDRWPAMWLEAAAAAVAATMETTTTERQRLLGRRRLSYRMSVEKRRTVDASSQNKNANELNEREGTIDEAITFEVGTKLLLLLLLGILVVGKFDEDEEGGGEQENTEREVHTYIHMYILRTNLGSRREKRNLKVPAEM